MRTPPEKFRGVGDRSRLGFTFLWVNLFGARNGFTGRCVNPPSMFGMDTIVDSQCRRPSLVS